MKEILLCTHNPLLIKAIYGILIDEGCRVEIADHPARAVQMVLDGEYSVLIIDSEPFGLSGEDAVEIIRNVRPDLPVISVGSAKRITNATSVIMPLDLAEFKKTVYDIFRIQSIK